MNPAQPKPLYEFWKDTATRDNVHQYMTEFLKREAVDMLFNGEYKAIEYVHGMNMAKTIIDRAFYNLDLMFEPKQRDKLIVNEAR